MCCAHAGQVSGNFDANVRRLQKCRGGIAWNHTCACKFGQVQYCIGRWPFLTTSGSLPSFNVCICVCVTPGYS